MDFMMRPVTGMLALAIFSALVGLPRASSCGGTRPKKGPLAGPPSPPGPHIDKIKALGDNEWLSLGSPAADPKWGKARGRS